MLNAMRYLGKDMSEIKLVCSGAGAAALACLNMLKTLGVKDENIIVCDQHGVLRHDREAPMDQYKAREQIQLLMQGLPNHLLML